MKLPSWPPVKIKKKFHKKTFFNLLKKSCSDQNDARMYLPKKKKRLRLTTKPDTLLLPYQCLTVTPCTRFLSYPVAVPAVIPSNCLSKTNTCEASRNLNPS